MYTYMMYTAIGVPWLEETTLLDGHGQGFQPWTCLGTSRLSELLEPVPMLGQMEKLTFRKLIDRCINHVYHVLTDTMYQADLQIRIYWSKHNGYIEITV